MAQVPLAAVFTQDDLHEQASYTVSDESDSTPLLRLSKAAIEDGYDSVCIPLTNEAWRTRWKKMCLTVDGKQTPEIERLAEDWRASEGPFLKAEMNITRLDEAVTTIGMVSEWLELDSPDDGVRYDSEIALKQELAYASYLNVPAVVLPPPRNREHVADYARAVNACLKATTAYLHISVRIPIYDPRSASPNSLQQTAPENVPLSVHARAPDGDLSMTWEMWDVIRSICSYSPRLSLALDLSLPLPSSSGVLSRWASEPCYQIFLPATSFISNAKGYPVLTKSTQTFLRHTFKYNPTILLARTRSRVHQNGGPLAYAQYVRHLERTSPEFVAAQQPGTLENYAKGYWDYLQAPLQPLMDNLGSGTYETFERDPVKYERYEEAIFQALSDRGNQGRTVICLVGAGRGGIVTRCLQALDRSKCDGIVYAVEKNPNAFVTLQEHKENNWGSRVHLIYGDMRKIQVPEPVDVLVSELLGSFGDNEASPECLDGAMRFLKPDGISIPSSYTAYLAPISSPKLHNELLLSTNKASPETPYVVMLQAVNMLSGDGGGLRGACGSRIQECWTFNHPRRDAVLNDHGLPITNAHNTRSARLTFHIPHAGVIHGLAGYFEAVLYRDVGLSIHPEGMGQISPGMLSWFPLFFPFRDPLYLPSNSELQVSIWRVTGRSKIWYEWYAESYLPVLSAPPPFGPVNPSPTKPSSFDHSKTMSTPASNFLSPTTPGTSSPMISPAPSPTSMVNDWAAKNMGAGGIKMGTSGEAGSGGTISVTVIKIGQTALHNPEGRGSWTGL